MTVRVDGGGQAKEVNLSLPGTKQFSVKKKFKLHYLMAKTFFNGFNEETHDIIHVDGDKGNNHIQNLTIKPKGAITIDCTSFADVIHPKYPEIGKLYKICRCGKHVLSKKTKNIITQRKNRCGYMEVHLYPDEACQKTKAFVVHQLVAHTFLKNPYEENYVVDHINRDKADNRLENLRFATYSENNANSSFIVSVKKPVNKYDLQGKLIKEYDSITAIMDENPAWSSSGICLCLRSELMRHTAYGFRWQYKNESDKNIKYEAKEGEIFKNIENVEYFNNMKKIYETITFNNYEVSNFGTVRNKKTRYIVGTNDGISNCVSLVESKKRRVLRLHVLVASVFLPKPNIDSNTMYIKFKDGDVNNCHVDNLEWISHQDKCIEVRGKPVIKIDTDGNREEFPSVSKAVEWLANHFQQDCSNYGGCIRGCLSGYQETAFGFRWVLADSDTSSQVSS
jgi:hypothetical protein